MTKDVFIKEVRDAEAMLYHISKSILKNLLLVRLWTVTFILKKPGGQPVNE